MPNCNYHLLHFLCPNSIRIFLLTVIEEANWLNLVADLRDMKDRPNKFDAVICLGNSFPHLLDYEGNQVHKSDLQINIFRIFVIAHLTYLQLTFRGQIFYLTIHDHWGPFYKKREICIAMEGTRVLRGHGLSKEFDIESSLKVGQISQAQLFRKVFICRSLIE